MNSPNICFIPNNDGRFIKCPNCGAILKPTTREYCIACRLIFNGSGLFMGEHADDNRSTQPVTVTDQTQQGTESTPVPKKRGRPKGSKNKPKTPKL